MNTQLAIQERDLELVVSEKTLGSLTTNAKQIRDIVMANLPKYDISNYTDDNIDQAKRDKASLNKAAKDLNSKRLEIEKEFMKPFGEFKEVVNETVKLIGECSAKIDTVAIFRQLDKGVSRSVGITRGISADITVAIFRQLDKGVSRSVGITRGTSADSPVAI